MINIILGSKSPGRKKILTKMGFSFTVMDPNIDEKAIRNKDPKKLVLDLAYAKAAALLPKITKPTILITADQVVRCNNKILEKPQDKKEAEKFLRIYTKHPAETITAVVVTNTGNKKQMADIDIATIWFTKISENIIKKLAQQKYVLTCAGGFSIDDAILKQYIAKIVGTKDSITGLPQKLTKKLIKEVIKNA